MIAETAPILRNNVAGLVDAYTQAVADVTQAAELMLRAKQRMGSAFGEHRDALFSGHISDYGLKDLPEIAGKIMLKNAWTSIAERTGFRSLMSIKTREDFDKQIERGDLPTLTEEHIWSFIQGLGAKVNSLLDDSAREVFEWLRPHRSQYKTNTEFELGRKVVLGFMVENWAGSKFHPAYRKEQHIIALDNVFHLLDGKGPVKDQGEFLQTMKTAMQAGATSCTTTYFKAKWFRNHNMHLEFLRSDLVDQLNALAGGRVLKPTTEDHPCTNSLTTVG